MRIMYCCLLKKSDGGMIHADQFVSAFRKNGHEVVLIHQQPLYLPAFFSKLPWMKYILAKLLWALVNIWLLIRCMTSFLATRPDVLVFRHSLTHDNFLARFVLGMFRPMVLEVNAVNEIETATSSVRTRVALDRLAISQADRIFVVSEPIEKFLVERNYCPKEKVAVIPNGVDEEVFDPARYPATIKQQLGISADTFVVGFIGNFKKWHGVGNVINAAKACKGELNNTVFLIIGDGALRAQYEKEVTDAGLQDYIRFLGRVKHAEIPYYLVIMDVVLSLHYKEPENAEMEFHGSPLKIFEYMAMARPIIASPVGQVKSLIRHEHNGMLIDGENSEAIKSALVLLRQNSDFRQQLGRNARATILKEYTWRQNARRVEVLCRDSQSNWQGVTK